MNRFTPGETRPQALATLVLVVVSTFAVESHSGPELIGAVTPDQERVFLSAHAGPENSAHLDPASGVVARHCPACLLSLRDRSLAPLRPSAATSLEIRDFALPPAQHFRRDCFRRGPSPRAPPLT